MSKQAVLKEKQYVNAWTSICSTLMFFISFFTAYFVSGNEITTAFVKSVFILIVTNVILKGLVLIWQLSIPKEQWMLMVHGAPAVDSRSTKRNSILDQLVNDENEVDDTNSH